MQKPILYTLIIATLLIFAFLFLWLPKYQEVANAFALLDSKKEELQKKEEYFDQLREISQKLQGFSSELAKIESALPPSQNIPDTFNFISAAASRNGLILRGTQVGESRPLKEESSIFKTNLSFSVVGPYPGLPGFIAELQSSSRLISFEEISLKKAGQDNLFKFDFIISTYSY